ncbi:transcription factor 20 isoform X2 [Echeneis naucrates]|uniref:Transcription factor 20-like n=1 Tax=Echeneis naucrates TaxID=173247 RepID=A0A665WW58_ECHNA|nr:transcription factor 20-like isoform X2 [Echeneis naucrates]
MEQAAGSLDDLQPQDLSTTSLPTVIDLTRKGEECVLNATSLQMVKSPGWYPNSGTGTPGIAYSDAGSSDISFQSGDHIQPDNAFAHTTVTLSYVSRSHVFPTQDTMSQHSALCGMPTMSKFSLRPSCDSEKGLGETDYSLNQHYLEQVESPGDLASQTDVLQSQVGPENDGGLCPTQEVCLVNGGVISSDEDTDKQVEEKDECSLPRKSSKGLENGQDHSPTSSGECVDSSTETLTPSNVENDKGGGSEVVFVMSKKQDPVVTLDSKGARDLCSLRREFISPLEDPVSPSATSLDDVEEVFTLPQTSSSPSGDNLYLETEESTIDDLSTEGGIQPGSGISNSTTELDSKDESKKAVIEPLIDFKDDVCVSDVSEDKSKTVTPHMNGSTKALRRNLKEKKLPVRSSRGTRLEAIVMNINSSKYKVSGCMRTNKKACASQSKTSGSNTARPKRNSALSVGRRSRVGTLSAKTVKQKAGTNIINTDNSIGSTSDSEILSHANKLHSNTHPKSPQFTVHKKSKKESMYVSHPVHSPQSPPAKSKRSLSQSSPQAVLHQNSKKVSELLIHPKPSEEIHVARVPSPESSKSPKKSPGKAKGKTKGSTKSPTAKTKAGHTPKRKRKKHKGGQSSSMFSPKEPEIKLKYINYKEEKRDLRLDSFSPFIRVQRQQSLPSLCTVINYPEEVRTQHKKGQQQQAHSSGFVSAVVPSTSCLQLGRVSMHSQHQRSLVCCLCGQSANAMDLGDLHGPYYPEGYQPSTKTPASISSLKEDDYSDSDSSSCSIRGGRRKCTSPRTLWSLRQGAQLKQKGLLEGHRWTGDNSGSPAAKRARSDANSAEVEDWYSPPVLPLEPCEYWLHEDCGIWSAGVFLVKGKVYGLEEAVKVAQETVCSACHDPGATLGCFFKGCPNKYHYRCALESDCVLIEDNFSMKCKKHKNKTFKTPPGIRWDDS